MLKRLFGRPAPVTTEPVRPNKPVYVNQYAHELTPEEIADGKHRAFVGGLWEELGVLQFEFMKKAGLLPHHRLVDVGCGALRGGIYFVPYLEPGHYHGIDLNASLIEAGKKELIDHRLADRGANLLVTDRFDMAPFGVQFDYALAVSVFTHLDMNHILRCLVETRKVLAPSGKFFSTFFHAPTSLHLEEMTHTPGGVVTHFDSDPFHYSLDEMADLARRAGLQVDLIGEWGHPRDQRMLCFSIT